MDILKVKDFFKNRVYLHGDCIVDDHFHYATMSCEHVVNGMDAGEVICKIINNHDGMVDTISKQGDSISDLEVLFSDVDVSLLETESNAVKAFNKAEKYGCRTEDCLHDAIQAYLKDALAKYKQSKGE